ncbi:MAG: hypothetical protein ABIZ05_03150 [Pseudonocardiaceae bacterium]
MAAQENLAFTAATRYSRGVTEPTQFVTMRLTGSRFEHSGMPVDVLPELAVYQELIVTVARELFLRRYPGRQRVPRGFAESFQLRLERVDKGSVVPVLERVNPDVAPPEFDKVFVESRDLVQSAIIGAATSGRLPVDFPGNALADFSRFGRTLRAGEFLEIKVPSSARPARYSAAVRRILMTSKLNGYTQEASINGLITGLNTEQTRFQLRVGPRLIPCSFEANLYETVVSKLAPPGGGDVVTVEGIVAFDSDGQPTSVPFVSGIFTPEDDPDEGAPIFSFSVTVNSEFSEINDRALSISAISARVFERLTALADLSPGWLDDEGESISKDVIDHVRRLLRDLHDKVLSEVYIYPTLEGGVRLEWQRSSTEFSLDFRPDRTVLYDEIDLGTGSETERQLSFDDFKDVRVLLVGA